MSIMSEEEKKAIERLKLFEYRYALVQNDDKVIETIVNLIEKLTEKVKQLEKGNRSLMESRIKWKNRYYKEKEKNKENQVLIDDIKDHRIVYIDTPEFEEKFISRDKIRERIKHNEEQKNIVESVAKFKINDDGITGEGIEGLNDLIVYKSYEAVINELNYLLEE